MNDSAYLVLEHKKGKIKLGVSDLGNEQRLKEIDKQFNKLNIGLTVNYNDSIWVTYPTGGDIVTINKNAITLRPEELDAFNISYRYIDNNTIEDLKYLVSCYKITGINRFTKELEGCMIFYSAFKENHSLLILLSN